MIPRSLVIWLFAAAFAGETARAQPAVAPSTVPTSRPVVLTYDLTTKAARAIQAQLDSRLTAGPNTPMGWRDKGVPGQSPGKPDLSNTVLTLDYQPPPPATDDRLPGLIVFISPSEGPMLPPEYLAALARRRMAVISPREAGNGRWVNWRVFAAVAAAKLAQEQTPIDPGRIYISGMSGGGKMACIGAIAAPETFAGALALCGAVHYRHVQTGRNNEMYPGFSPDLSRSVIDAARNHPIVLMTGNRDFNREPTLTIEAALKEDGFLQVSSRVCADLGHSRPRAGDFESGLITLDDPALLAAGKLFQEAIAREKQNKVGVALRLFHQAYSRNAELAPQAEANYRRLKAQRDAEAAVWQAVEGPSRIAAEKRFTLKWDPKK